LRRVLRDRYGASGGEEKLESLRGDAGLREAHSVTSYFWIGGNLV
jgi:hypothetical protein